MDSPLRQRSSGILLHPTCLAGPFAHGDLGPCSREFVDFLESAGQRWWQMLPIHPAGGGDSPYDSPSAFAGSEGLISLEDVAEMGLIPRQEVLRLTEAVTTQGGAPTEGRTQFALGKEARLPLLQQASANFETSSSAQLKSDYEQFMHEHDAWVWDYALFMAVRQETNYQSWVKWEPELRSRQQTALDRAHNRLRDEVKFRVFCQFLFHRQWATLKEYATQHGVLLMGDIPMFVSHDSVDVWANQHLFFVDAEGERTVQAGVPPDYFSEDGQLWGNPLYRWEVMRDTDYGWWIDRLRRELSKFDAVRIDHFIALSRYWEIPMDAETAKSGRYVTVDGAHFLSRAKEHLGGLPFVAEDLGVLTREVEELRDQFELPGMKILQFSFSRGAESYLPHRHPVRAVVYLGTHDNDTTRGWFTELEKGASLDNPEAAARKFELERATAYSGIESSEDATQRLMRSLMASPAETAIVTMQDLLNQDSRARMNVPGIGTGNWTYRMPSGALTVELARELRRLTDATERLA